MKLSDEGNETLERALFARRAHRLEAIQAPVLPLEAILAQADAGHAHGALPARQPLVSSPREQRFGRRGVGPRFDRTRTFVVSVAAAVCIAGPVASIGFTSVDRDAPGVAASGHASCVGDDGAEALGDHPEHDGCEGRVDETSQLSFCSASPYVLASRLEPTGAEECTATAASFANVTRDTLTCECGEACSVVRNRY